MYIYINIYIYIYIYIYVYSESLFNTLYIEVKQISSFQILKKILLDKIIVMKNALFFLSQAPTHHCLY